MNHLRVLVCLGLIAGGLVRTRAEERNAWPLAVQRINTAGQSPSTTALGPLFFEKTLPDGGRATGFRPFFLERTDATGRLVEATSLYPLYAYRADAEAYSWTVFNVINRSGAQPGAAPALRASNAEKIAVWPFYFSRQTGDPATSYRGLLPIAGEMKDYLGYDRIAWTVFPLYTAVDKRGARTTLTPWPILRVTRGAETGFALWPLFGWRDRPGETQRRFALWPLIWNHTLQPSPDAPAGAVPTRQIGVLPLYSREQNADFVNENFIWPFFGRTRRSAPYRYEENRYLWPFLVQGRGDDRIVNRWGPFYTRSVIKGYDKTWIGWPLWQQARWQSDGLAHTRTQLLYFLYASVEQRSLSNPNAAPAEKVHLWPLLSAWDNGAGRRQYQFPSPLEVFFPGNDLVRQTWTPLFALYRYDERAPGEARTSLLWDGVTWETSAREARTEFHLGPLLSVQSHAAAHRIALLNGVIGIRRNSGERMWRLFWLDFPGISPKLSPTAPATTDR